MGRIRISGTRHVTRARLVLDFRNRHLADDVAVELARVFDPETTNPQLRWDLTHLFDQLRRLVERERDLCWRPMEGETSRDELALQEANNVLEHPAFQRLGATYLGTDAHPANRWPTLWRWSIQLPQNFTGVAAARAADLVELTLNWEAGRERHETWQRLNKTYSHALNSLALATDTSRGEPLRVTRLAQELTLRGQSNDHAIFGLNDAAAKKLGARLQKLQDAHGRNVRYVIRPLEGETLHTFGNGIGIEADPGLISQPVDDWVFASVGLWLLRLARGDDRSPRPSWDRVEVVPYEATSMRYSEPNQNLGLDEEGWNGDPADSDELEGDYYEVPPEDDDDA